MISQDQHDRAAAATTGTTPRIAANLDHLRTACDAAAFPFALGLALMEKESRGRNVYGADAGGALSGYKGEVSPGSYDVFLWLLGRTGSVSNGVGPLQLTYRGYHVGPASLTAKGLRGWDPADSILYAIRDVLAPALRRQAATKLARAAFRETARAYNAGATGGEAYADDALAKADEWTGIVGTSDTLLAWTSS
jgi:hypothetical protein